MGSLRAAAVAVLFLCLLAGCAAAPALTLHPEGRYIHIGGLQRGALMVECPGRQNTLHGIGVLVTNHSERTLVLDAMSWSVTWPDGSVRPADYVEDAHATRPPAGVAPGATLNLTVFACAPNPISGNATHVALLDGPRLDAPELARLRLDGGRGRSLGTA